MQPREILRMFFGLSVFAAVFASAFAAAVSGSCGWCLRCCVCFRCVGSLPLDTRRRKDRARVDRRLWCFVILRRYSYLTHLLLLCHNIDLARSKGVTLAVFRRAWTCKGFDRCVLLLLCARPVACNGRALPTTRSIKRVTGMAIL